jgi:hypothetical protein
MASASTSSFVEGKTEIVAAAERWKEGARVFSRMGSRRKRGSDREGDKKRVTAARDEHAVLVLVRRRRRAASLP